MKLRKGLLSGVVGLAAAGALALTPATAFARGGPPTTEAGNNLSIPTVFVGTNPFGLDCLSGPVDPIGTPTNGYPIDPALYYYVQGVDTWQAQCATATSGSVNVAWGDNLGGDAALVVNHPIRVEVALSDSANTNMTGYNVYKLNPAALDRESDYGTPATVTTAADGTVSYSANPVTFPNPGFWVAGATWRIYNKTTDAPVFSGPATAEINATGRVVYGYNLRVNTPGTYVIEFTLPSDSGVTINSADLGTYTGQTATTEITVTGSRGGGGGGGGGGGHHGGR
ncbi:MAG TPA: hypothetical protein VFO01_10890 [Trebonia sp.]|nr:hypothetical protein [Trebonia sp.]